MTAHSPAAAAAELLRRKRLRTDLAAWCTEVLAPLDQKPAAHHLAIIEKLTDVAEGRCDRLMILAPPGSAKSTYVSVLFPSWFLARNPGSAIIAASHTQELAERFGRKVRNIIEEHSVSLGYGLAGDSAAAQRFETDHGSGKPVGEYFAIGLGGAVAGRRADLMIIDDPVKSRADAESPLQSGRAWDWYLTDAETRLKPGGRVVLVMTRWHELDLGGRLLEDAATGGKPWEVLRIPMIADSPDDPLGRPEGELLWKDWYTPDMLRQAQRDARLFASLYQQNPVPDTGGYFEREWVHKVAVMPPRHQLRTYIGTDFAVTGKGGDYSVIIVVGIDHDDRIYVLNVWRQQASPDVWVEALADQIIEYKPMAAAEEKGQIRSSIGPFLETRLRERGAYVHRVGIATNQGDKSIRAQSIRGRMAMVGLYVPADAPWLAQFEQELFSFPAGRNDDVVDALSLTGLLLDQMVPPGRKKHRGAPIRDGYDRAQSRAMNGGEEVDSWKLI